jgi:D-proline reductase (dithiol) PrdB
MSEPIRYVDRLKAHYEIQGFPPYSWTINEDTPMRRLDKALSECRVSMLTSGGVSSCSAPAWNPHARNDFRLDAVDGEPESDVFQIHDAYYDHGDADRDLNCVFPIDRLRELAAEGFVGAVAPRLWSGFMGRIYKRRAVIEEHAPALASELASDEVDLFLLVPT